MKVFLNERSIPEKVSDSDEIFTVLSRLIHLAAAARKMSNNQNIQRHRDLKYKEVLTGMSLLDYIMALGKHADPNKRKLKTLFLELFAKAPFLVGFHSDGETITDGEKNCLKYSCFDDASACRTGAAVISAQVSANEEDSYLIIESSIFGQRKILNIKTIEQLNQIIWIYESNDKHDIPRDIIVDGETHSAMHLNSDEAQLLLSNGIKIGKCIFNRHGDQWYKFHCHDKNIYHGFPIDVKTPYKEFSQAKILLEEIGVNADGQLFAELLEIRAST